MNKIYKLVRESNLGKSLAAAIMLSLLSSQAYAAIPEGTASEKNIAIGDNSGATGDNSVAIGTGAQANGSAVIAIGDGAQAEARNSLAIGRKAAANNIASLAVMNNAKAEGQYSMAIGVKAKTNLEGGSSVAIGTSSWAMATDSVALGSTSKAWGESSLAALGATTGKESDEDYVSDKNYGQGAIAIGNNALAEANNSFAIGAAAKATAVDSIAFGNCAEVRAENAVALGAGSVADVANTVSVGAEGAERKIVNVAAGDITSANSTEAVTGGQLYETNTKIGTWSAGNTIVAYDATTAATTSLGANLANLDTAIGDLAANKGQGNVIANEATAAAQIKALDTKLGSATGGNYIQATNTVAQNLSALDTQTKANADAIEDNTSEIIKNRADIETNRVHIEDEAIRAKAAEKANADAIAAEKNERINADNELRNEIQGVNSNLNNKINQTNDRVDRVGATAAALAAINYQPMAKGQSQVAVGMGGYKGKKATALGLAYQISDRVSGSVAGSANGSERMFNVGFNYVFGQHSDKDIAQCAAVPGSMSLTEAELKAENISLKNKLAEQDARITRLEAGNVALATPVPSVAQKQTAAISISLGAAKVEIPQGADPATIQAILNSLTGSAVK